MLEYLVTAGFEILNRGNEATFCRVAKCEIDFILCSRSVARKIVDWGISNKPFGLQENNLQARRDEAGD